MQAHIPTRNGAKALAMRFSQLTSEQKLALRTNLQSLIDVIGNQLEHGTLLSGSNVQLLVQQDLAELFFVKFGLRLDPVVKYNNEILVWRQKILQELSPAPIFPDVMKMAACPESIADIIDQPHRLPRTHLLVFAIECDTISRLAKGWTERLTCVWKALTEQVESKTGSTAVAAMKVVSLTKCFMFLAECVRALLMKDPTTKKSPFDIVAALAAEQGFWTAARVTDGKFHGSACQRERVYVVGMYVGKEKAQQCLADEGPCAWDVALDEALATLAISPLPITSFLLSDEEIKQIVEEDRPGELKAAKQIAKRKAKAKAKAKVIDQQTGAEPATNKYEVDHCQAYCSHGLPYPPEFSREWLSKAGFTSRRVHEIVYLAQTIHPLHSMTSWFACDTNMSFGWSKWYENSLPCIVSSAQIWIRGKLDDGSFIDRRLEGAECLAVMGFDMAQQPAAMRALSYSNKVDLAGTMFDANTVSTFLLAMYATLPLADAAKLMSEHLAGGLRYCCYFKINFVRNHHRQ